MGCSEDQVQEEDPQEPPFGPVVWLEQAATSGPAHLPEPTLPRGLSVAPGDCVCNSQGASLQGCAGAGRAVVRASCQRAEPLPQTLSSKSPESCWVERPRGRGGACGQGGLPSVWGRSSRWGEGSGDGCIAGS